MASEVYTQRDRETGRKSGGGDGDFDQRERAREDYYARQQEQRRSGLQAAAAAPGLSTPLTYPTAGGGDMSSSSRHHHHHHHTATPTTTTTTTPTGLGAFPALSKLSLNGGGERADASSAPALSSSSLRPALPPLLGRTHSGRSFGGLWEDEMGAMAGGAGAAAGRSREGGGGASAASAPGAGGGGGAGVNGESAVAVAASSSSASGIRLPPLLAGAGGGAGSGAGSGTYLPHSSLASQTIEQERRRWEAERAQQQQQQQQQQSSSGRQGSRPHSLSVSSVSSNHAGANGGGGAGAGGLLPSPSMIAAASNGGGGGGTYSHHHHYRDAAGGNGNAASVGGGSPYYPARAPLSRHMSSNSTSAPSPSASQLSISMMPLALSSSVHESSTSVASINGRSPKPYAGNRSRASSLLEAPGSAAAMSAMTTTNAEGQQQESAVGPVTSTRKRRSSSSAKGIGSLLTKTTSILARTGSSSNRAQQEQQHQQHQQQQQVQLQRQQTQQHQPGTPSSLYDGGARLQPTISNASSLGASVEGSASIAPPAEQQRTATANNGAQAEAAAAAMLGDPSAVRRLAHLQCEQRRRESINGGFATLRGILPETTAADSKAAILQKAIYYIQNLEHLMQQHGIHIDTAAAVSGPPELLRHRKSSGGGGAHHLAAGMGMTAPISPPNSTNMTVAPQGMGGSETARSSLTDINSIVRTPSQMTTAEGQPSATNGGRFKSESYDDDMDVDMDERLQALPTQSHPQYNSRLGSREDVSGLDLLVGVATAQQEPVGGAGKNGKTGKRNKGISMSFPSMSMPSMGVGSIKGVVRRTTGLIHREPSDSGKLSAVDEAMPVEVKEEPMQSPPLAATPTGRPPGGGLRSMFSFHSHSTPQATAPASLPTPRSSQEARPPTWPQQHREE